MSVLSLYIVVYLACSYIAQGLGLYVCTFWIWIKNDSTIYFCICTIGTLQNTCVFLCVQVVCKEFVLTLIWLWHINVDIIIHEYWHSSHRITRCGIRLPAGFISSSRIASDGITRNYVKIIFFSWLPLVTIKITGLVTFILERPS